MGGKRRLGYRTSFTVTMEQLEQDDAQLIFEGLDTYADVYLNWFPYC